MRSFLDTLNRYLQLGIDKISDNVTGKDKYGAIFVPGLSIIICVVIYYAGAYNNGAWKRKGKAHPAYMRSMSIALLQGGHLALQRLVDYHEAQAELEVAEENLKKLLAADRPSFRQLQVRHFSQYILFSPLSKISKYICMYFISNDRR